MKEALRMKPDDRIHWVDKSISALSELEDKVFAALQQYKELASLHGDDTDVLIKATHEWLDEEGNRCLESIRQRILDESDPEMVEKMYRSIRAAISAGDAAMQRDMSRPEHRYMLWEWADQIISSVNVAFETALR